MVCFQRRFFSGVLPVGEVSRHGAVLLYLFGKREDSRAASCAGVGRCVGCDADGSISIRNRGCLLVVCGCSNRPSSGQEVPSATNSNLPQLSSGVLHHHHRRAEPDPGAAEADHSSFPLQPGGKDQLRDAGGKAARITDAHQTVNSAVYRGWFIAYPGAEGETGCAAWELVWSYAHRWRYACHGRRAA